MPYHIELGSDPKHKYHDKGIVVNAVTGHHMSKDPIPIKKAQAQLKILNAIHHKEKIQEKK
jgi:hypothetical protein